MDAPVVVVPRAVLFEQQVATIKVSVHADMVLDAAKDGGGWHKHIGEGGREDKKSAVNRAIPGESVRTFFAFFSMLAPSPPWYLLNADLYSLIQRAVCTSMNDWPWWAWWARNRDSMTLAFALGRTCHQMHSLFKSHNFQLVLWDALAQCYDPDLWFFKAELQLSDRDIVAPLEPMDLNLFTSTNPLQFFIILTNVTDGTRSIHIIHEDDVSYEEESNIDFIFIFTFGNLPNLPVDMTGYTMSFYAQMMNVTVCLFKDFRCGSSEDMDIITNAVHAGTPCLYTISPSSYPYCVGEEVEYTTTSKYRTPAVDNDIKNDLYSMKFFNLVYIYTELSDDGSVVNVHNNDDSYEHYRLRFEDPEEKNLVVTSCEVHTGFNLTETDEEMHNIHKAMFDRLHKSVW